MRIRVTKDKAKFGNGGTLFEQYLQKYSNRPSTDTLSTNVKVNPHPQYTPQELQRIQDLENARTNTLKPLSKQELQERYKRDIQKNPEIKKWLDQQQYGSEEPMLNMPFLPANYPIQEFAGGGTIKGTKEQFQAYQDSLKLYNESQEALNYNRDRIKNKINNFSPFKNYEDAIGNLFDGDGYKPIYKETFKPIEPSNPNHIEPNQYAIIGDFDFHDYRTPSDELKYRALRDSFYKAGKNHDTKSMVNYRNQMYKMSSDNGSYYDFIDLYPKPTTPIDYKETITTQPIKQRKKEEKIELDSMKPDFLTTDSNNIEFNPIGFKKGTYFTRKPQQQEIKSGNKKDYFDKQGKFLGTFKNGGYIQSGDWEIIE